MAKPKLVRIQQKSRRLRMAWLGIALITIIKLLAIPNLDHNLSAYHSGAWLGADGETYVLASEQIIREGVFSASNLLLYFAPGYSFFLALLSLLFHSYALLMLSFLQTIFYGFSVYFFSKQLIETKLESLIIPFAFLALINPTLTLSSLVVGYESLIASIFLLCLGLFIHNLKSKKSELDVVNLLLCNFFLGVCTWLSPRMILPSLLLNLFWIYLKTKSKKKFMSGFFLILFLMSFQGSLMLRNEIATGTFTTQTSIGALAIMGAGPNATGTYTEKDTGLVCAKADSLDSITSNQKIVCAAEWYAHNPGKGALLLWKKSYYLWSPWFGPLYGGTMARNPYLNFHPIKTIISNQNQLNLVMGLPGKIISWFWILGGWALLFLGYRQMMSLGGLEKHLGQVMFLMVIVNWFVVLIGPGDNRYRLPLMPLSIFLQIKGYIYLRNKLAKAIRI